jgi:hypothetical protein
MRKISQDQLFREVLESDSVGKPDRQIESRLLYSFMLKNSQTKTRQNSFSSFFSWIFSIQSLGLKTGMVSLVVFLSMLNPQFYSMHDHSGSTDSIIEKRVLLADSTYLNQTIDSLQHDSLN